MGVRLPSREYDGFSYGHDESYSELGDYAWYNKNSWNIGQQYAHVVGLKKANAWGLYDMHGNVWEWCSDWYGRDYYANAENVDPKGPTSGGIHVLRGGSFYYTNWNCRLAFRGDYDNPQHPVIDGSNIGFRVVVNSE